MFPQKPAFSAIVGSEARKKAFGDLQFIHAPVKGNQENISIKGPWARENLVVVHIPQLSGIAGAPVSCKIQCHRIVAEPLRLLFAELEQLDLLDDIHTWGGMFCPRLIRGSKTVLSNHAFGTAFDINAQWNPLGAAPAAEGKLGCVYKIVPVANKYGFYWGGHYQKRPDGMHFEFSRV